MVPGGGKLCREIMDISSFKKKYASYLKDDMPFWVVDSNCQKIVLVEHLKETMEFPVSTSAKGLGNKENSYKTPTGLHRVDGLIGHGAPVGTVFVGRKATGRIWDGFTSDEDLILTRVITLEGCEEGVNKGPGVDTLERYIYIHGTNSEHLVGTPASKGCIRMRNGDIIALFDLCTKGMFVVII